MAAVSSSALLAWAAAAGTVATIYNGAEQRRLQKRTNAANQANAAKAEKQAEEATNRANQKAPDVESLMDAASLTGKAGNTLLNGPQGADPNALLLGKNTLLGQ